MKTIKTFKNATLRTINNGYIELDYNGKTECFHDASVVSVNNGSISIEVDWEPKEGELVKITGTFIDAYCIIDKLDDKSIHCFGCKKIYYDGSCLKNISWRKSSETKISPVTPEEQQAFDDFCKSKGKIWNKEKLQWEEYRWKPRRDEYYYFVATDQPNTVGTHKWVDDAIDNRYYDNYNCFQTKEEAIIVAEKVKELLKSL